MNTNYYPNPMYPGSQIPQVTPNQQIAPSIQPPFPEEQSYIENILRLNKGKLAKFYLSYPDSVEWRDKTFTGIIEEAGRDHIIISDPKSGMWNLLLIIYLNYVEFQEKINYGPGLSYNGR